MYANEQIDSADGLTFFNILRLPSQVLEASSRWIGTVRQTQGLSSRFSEDLQVLIGILRPSLTILEDS